ncbi:MAG: hypothetical protein AAF431_14670 [Pseudomonadota bacterium]
MRKDANNGEATEVPYWKMKKATEEGAKLQIDNAKLLDDQQSGWEREKGKKDSGQHSPEACSEARLEMAIAGHHAYSKDKHRDEDPSTMNSGQLDARNNRIARAWANSKHSYYSDTRDDTQKKVQPCKFCGRRGHGEKGRGKPPQKKVRPAPPPEAFKLHDWGQGKEEKDTSPATEQVVHEHGVKALAELNQPEPRSQAPEQPVHEHGPVAAAQQNQQAANNTPPLQPAHELGPAAAAQQGGVGPDANLGAPPTVPPPIQAHAQQPPQPQVQNRTPTWAEIAGGGNEGGEN